MDIGDGERRDRDLEELFMPREHSFPVEVSWDGGRRTTAAVTGKQPLDITVPPEFGGTDPDVWSPEDAFVAAAGSCLVVTIAALADREGVPLHDLDVRSVGVVGRRPDGQYGFVRLEHVVEIETDGGSEDAARALVDEAEKGCLVSVSVAVPIEATVHVRLRPAPAEAA
jgi:peroxiredoxin-like protein